MPPSRDVTGLGPLTEMCALQFQKNLRLKQKLMQADQELSKHRSLWTPESVEEFRIRISQLEAELATVTADKEESDARAEINAQVKKQLAQQLQALLIVRQDGAEQGQVPVQSSVDVRDDGSQSWL